MQCCQPYDWGKPGGGDRALARDMAARVSPSGAALVVEAKAVAEDATNGDEVGNVHQSHHTNHTNHIASSRLSVRV